MGNWGVTLFPAAGEGGGGLGKPPQPPYPRVSALRLDGVPWKYPFVPLKLGIFQQLRDTILEGQPYQAHGWFISRQNPVLSLPDRQRTLEALGKMDFIVTVDIIMNDTAWFSDVVLPEASYLERYDPLLPVGDSGLPAPAGDRAAGRGQIGAVDLQSSWANAWDWAISSSTKTKKITCASSWRPLGVTLDEMQAGRGYVELPEGEPDRSVHLEHSQRQDRDLLQHAGKRASSTRVPVWQEPLQPKPGAFYLLTGKVGQHTQFGTQNNQLLHKYQDEPRLWMNPEAAAKLGLKDGDLVEVTSEVGAVHVAPASHPCHPSGLRVYDARLWTSIQRPAHRLRRRRQLTRCCT